MFWLDAQQAVAPPSAPSPVWTVISALVGLLGVGFTNLLTWSKDRDRYQKRAKSLEEAQKVAAFWETSLSVAEHLDFTPEEGFKERAKTQLLYVSAHIDYLVEDHKDQLAAENYIAPFEVRRRSLRGWRRWFLLYAPPRRTDWFARLALLIWALYCCACLAFVPNYVQGTAAYIDNMHYNENLYTESYRTPVFGEETPEDVRHRQEMEESTRRSVAEFEGNIRDAKTEQSNYLIRISLQVLSLLFFRWLVVRHEARGRYNNLQ